MATASAEIAAEIELAARSGDRVAIALTARLADDIAQLCSEIDEGMLRAS